MPCRLPGRWTDRLTNSYKFRVKVELPVIIFRLSMVHVSRIFMDYGMAGHWHFFQNHPELQAEQDIGKSCGKNDEVEDMGFE